VKELLRENTEDQIAIYLYQTAGSDPDVSAGSCALGEAARAPGYRLVLSPESAVFRAAMNAS
jgi:hypothetical protein